MKYPTKQRTQNYHESYKNEVFLLWFNNHKPTAKRLLRMIPDTWEGDPPADGTLYNWIKESFEQKAAFLDKKLNDEIEGRLIQEKVEMLYRHGEMGRKMQVKAMAKLEGIDPEDLPAHAAVRLLVEGIRVERESVGLPQALEKMLSSTDENILNRIEKLTEDSQAEILIIDDESN